jgi:imidazolonepropionase-like amidohydrolase
MSARGVDLIVRGGRVVTATDDFEASVAIKGGRIVAIAPDGVLPSADRVIDAAGKVVFPGLIDCHLHVGPEYDDWKTSALAAARTGLTSIVPFVTDGCARRPRACRHSTSAFISSSTTSRRSWRASPRPSGSGCGPSRCS